MQLLSQEYCHLTFSVWWHCHVEKHLGCLTVAGALITAQSCKSIDNSVTCFSLKGSEHCATALRIKKKVISGLPITCSTMAQEFSLPHTQMFPQRCNVYTVKLKLLITLQCTSYMFQHCWAIIRPSVRALNTCQMHIHIHICVCLGALIFTNIIDILKVTEMDPSNCTHSTLNEQFVDCDKKKKEAT